MPGTSHSGHSHDHHRHVVRRRLLVATGLIAFFMLGEVVAAAFAGSLALLADAGHMLTDVGAMALSFWASRLAGRPAAGDMTFGLKRAEILSAAVNGLLLAVVATAVAVGAVARLAHPIGVDGAVVMVVAAAGMAINLAATLVLAGADRTSLNLRSALAHVLTDLWSFAATFAAGLVVVLTGFRRADAVASVILVAVLARSSWMLLRESGKILLEGAPEGVNLNELRDHILGVDKVASVHDLHAWVVTSDLPAVSAHVVVADACFANGGAPQVLDKLQACLAGHFDVEHSTFQLEPAGHIDHETGQHD